MWWAINSIVIYETSLWVIIYQAKNQFIKLLNEKYVVNPSISIFEEILKQEGSLQQLVPFILSKYLKFEIDNLKRKLVGMEQGVSYTSKEHEFDSHPEEHELNLHPYIPKEVLKLEVDELGYEEPNLENNHKHP